MKEKIVPSWDPVLLATHSLSLLLLLVLLLLLMARFVISSL